MKITHVTFVLLFQTLYCLAEDDSEFQLNNPATGFCLMKKYNFCTHLVWSTAGRLVECYSSKCLGVQGKSVGSELSFYDCDETSELQQWECKNETLLALKGQELYIEVKSDSSAILSKTSGPNNHLTIMGTTQGACSKTYREYFTIGGNAAGRPCMFPFLYKNNWYDRCIQLDKADNRLWCAVETKFEHELWGYCPTNYKESWKKNSTTGARYQLNTQSALTWAQAEKSCKQQSASLLSITDPNEQAYVDAILRAAGGQQDAKLWNGLSLDSEHGWQWSSGRPFRYVNWDSGYPNSSPGENCGVIDGATEYSWQTSRCNKKLGYVCYSRGALPLPTDAPEKGFCPTPWIPYNSHCFQLFRTKKTWSDAQKECRKEGGDLVSIRNVEDQSFVISQLGYGNTDELWIGLNDRKTEGLFDWSDTSTVTFTSWEFGKPAVASEKEDCVLMRGENGNWADRECGEKHGYICMKTSDSEATGSEVEPDAGCKTGWKKHGSYCYYVGTETKTFDEANKDCNTTDSYLADVSTGVDNAFLVSLVGLRPEKHFWLGLSNQEHIDFFVWTNTDSVKYTRWNAQMPGHHQGCVAMATGSLAGLWDVLPCTNKEKYICKHLAEGAVLTPVPPTPPALKCADGWTKSPARNICYQVYSQYSNKRTWDEARDYCRAIGGDLLSIHNTYELQMLPYQYSTTWSTIRVREDNDVCNIYHVLVYGTLWIGLSAPDSVHGYVWSDGSPVDFQHWENGQPDNKNNAESCAEIKLYKRNWDGSWNDEQCEKNNGWICQIHAGVTPKPPPDPVTPEQNTTSDGWLKWQGNQYYFNRDDLAMDQARSFCLKRHGDVVSIHSNDESVFLWKQISREYGSYWIGLEVDLDGTYQWKDGSQVVFQKWDEGQPDFKHFDEHCAVMSARNGFWHDYNCGREFKSICKRSGSTPANTTAEPPAPPKGGCQPPWIKINSKCYSISTNQNVTWDGAKNLCKQMQGNLATIPSRHVEVFLMSQMAHTPTRDLWIGLHNLHGQFLWTDGQQRSYVNLALQGRHRRPNHNNDWVSNWLWWFKRYLGGMRYEQTAHCTVINTNPLLGTGKWIPKSCNETNGFICHRNVDPSLPDSPEPTNPPTYVSVLNDSIKVVPDEMNWDAAKKHCERDGAHLASLQNEWTQAYVELLALNLNTSLWIGLNKKQTYGYFRFIDGWRLTLNRWGKDEPNSDRPCVYVDVDGKWKTAYCNETRSSVCMTSTDAPPTESPDFPGICPQDPDTGAIGQRFVWIPFRGYCYIFITEEKEWTDASTSCAQHGGTLASIEDPSEQEFLYSNVKIFGDSYRSFWVGLYKTHKGQWLWTDNTIMDYSNWGKNQPFEDSFGEISTLNGTWKVSKAWHHKPYICKTLKVNPPTPLPTHQPAVAPPHRSHVILAAVIVFAGFALGIVIAFFVFKKSGRRFPTPEELTAFDSPLFSAKQSQPDQGDTSQLVENAEKVDTTSVIQI